MSGGELAAIIGGLSGFIATMFGTWRVARADKMKQGADGAAVLLGGWRDFQAETLKEVDRVRTACQAEIAELKREHDEDRAAWKVRERAMQEEIDRLKAQVLILIESKARGER